MIPTLLWRCPLCKTHEALIEQARWFRPNRISCRVCGTVWELIRVVGGLDYRMRVVKGDQVGLERPLAEWYDLVKTDLRLEPIHDPMLELESGETLYLRSKPVELVAWRGDPLFEGLFSQTEALPIDSDSSLPELERLAVGTLFLTDRRLILRIDERCYDLWLASVSAVWLEVDRFLILRWKEGFYLFRFLEESLLKWLTYFKLVMRPIEQATGLQVYLAFD